MRARLLAIALLPAVLVGCASRMQPEVWAPLPGWVGAFTAAQSAAAAGDFARADSALAAFEREHPGTAEALEAVFWRGILALDPANPQGSAAASAAAFDQYLGNPAALQRRNEAAVLSRLAWRLDSLASSGTIATLQTAPAAAAGAARAGADPRDEELRRLREELRRANEELERIRRRLATPARPDPPPPS